MTSVQDFFTSRNNLADGTTQVGKDGRLWYDPVTNTIRVYNGNPGGLVVGSQIGGNVYAVNVIVSGAVYSDNYLFSNGATVITNVNGNIDLGNISIYDQTISGDINNRDITLSPMGTGVVVVPSIRVPTGNVGTGTNSIVYTLANVNLNEIKTYSTHGYDVYNTGDYGFTHGGTAPFSIFQFKQVPTPALQEGDHLTGPGIPINTVITAIGTGVNANVVATNTTLNVLTVPPPGPNDIMFVARDTTNASMNLFTGPQTDISLQPGDTGFVVAKSDVLPVDDSVYRLGSPLRRWKDLFLSSGSLYILDQSTQTDTVLTAKGGNLAVGGANGLTVGKFTLTGNTIALTNPTEDFYIGTTFATGNLNILRPLQVLNSSGQAGFEVDRNGLTRIYSTSGADATQSTMSIIGSASGHQQPRATQYDGTLLQLTAIDGKSARVSLDSFGTGVYPIISGRAARGTVDTPLTTVKDDVLLRFSAVGWTGNGLYGAALTRLDFKADQTFTSNVSTGTYVEIQTTPIGSNVITSTATFRGNVGMVLGANTGITFADSTRQTTAYKPENVVESLNLGTGFVQSGVKRGNVNLDNDAVLSLTGTANQVYVNGAITKVHGVDVTLTLPQDIAPSSSPTFNNLYLNSNLYITGNIISGGATEVASLILYLGNTATTSADINGGGIVLGNVNSPDRRSILYVYPGDYWTTDGAGFETRDLTAANVTVNTNLYVTGTNAHFGGYYEQVGFDYPNAAIQVDSNNNGVSQVVMQNHSTGTAASSDFVATADNGNDSSYYIDMGINGSAYADPAYNIGRANDGYVYVQDGNLSLGTTQDWVRIHTGGTTLANMRANINSAGIQVVGNVSANFYLGNGAFLTGIVSSYGNSNVASYLPTNSVITAIHANMTSANSHISVLEGNVVDLTSSLNSLIGNSTYQENEISGLRANIIAANSVVSAYQSFANTWLGNLQANVYSNVNTAAYLTTATISTTGNITANNISDSNGSIRSLPINAQGSAYTLVAKDNGNLVSISSGNVTVPAGVFTTPFGQAITVYNNSAVTRYITQGAGTTLRLGGTAATGNRTLTQYGLATIVCVSANTFVVSGVGLS